MENKNEIFNMPLASFTFGKDNQNMAEIYSNPLFSEIKTPSDNINNLPIQSSLSQDYFQTGQYKKYNNTSGALKKMSEFNLNQNNIEINNYNNNFYNTNQSAKIVNSNYGGEFTFGQNNDIKNINEINNQNDTKNFFNNSLKNNYRNYHDINNNSLKNNPVNYSQLTNNVNNVIFRPTFFDENNNENNSYITVILHTIFNIRPLFNYILNISQAQNNPANSQEYNIIFCLKEIFQKVQKAPNDKINIRKLKESLSSQFKNRRKFILNHPDDPVDLFFILLNSIHSFIIKSPINEISDEICNNKCFSHKYIWMDLTRIDECGCNGTSRRLFSNHNYITDIPMYQIFNYVKNSKYNISEINQKLFFCYKDILKNLTMNCPMNGTRCDINKTQHRLFLANSPSYFIFNLDYNEIFFNFNLNNNNFLLIDILKCFVLIAKTFDINMLFEENARNKNDYNINKKYNLFGIVFISLTKIYSCAFFHRGINNNSYFYYYKGNNNYVNFNSFYNLVLYSLKNGIIPLVLFYEEKNNNDINKRTLEKNLENNEILTKEQILHLEKYCNNIDNLFNNINNNKIRTNENILNTMLNKQNNNSNINNNNTINSNNKLKSSNNYKPNNNINNINNNKSIQNSKSNQNYIIDNNHPNNSSNENSLQNRNTNYKHNTYNNKSVQNHNIYINNNNNDNYYLQKNDTTNTSNEKLDDYSDKKYKKIKYETDVKHKANRMIKPNIEEYSSNLWEMPTPYAPYKKEEPITILPLPKNQNSLEVNNKANKGNSENYFYKNKLIKDNNYINNNNSNNNNINNNINIESIKKNEMKQKSNSYSKKTVGNNFKSLINNDPTNNNINSDNVNDIKRRIINNINNMEHQISKSKINKNPNSFNKNHNLRNINDDNVRKYTIGKANKSNFDLSNNNRPSNIPYNKNSINNNTNNISNISASNQNIKIADGGVPSDDIKRRFKSKRLINQVINYSSKSRKIRKNRINYEDDEMKSKSDDNMNNNIYNFNYIYNNNNFDMNILENNLDKNNIYNNYRITDDKYDKKKKIEKIKKNLNINNISNINSNNNNSYFTDNDKSIRTLNENNSKRKIQIGHWACPYCSNMNRDDLMYCKICRRNKEGKILRINTQLLRINQKMKKQTGLKNNIKGNNSGNNNTLKKNEIPKSKKMMTNSNRVNNKFGIKKLKRNTLIGFSSSKNFNIENYENFISNQNQKINDYNNNIDSIKKEYSFTKPSFNDRKYKNF